MCALGFIDFKLLIRARNWYLYLSNRFEFNLSYQAVYLQVLALKPVPWLRWSADRSLLPLASSQLQFFEKQIPERRATLLRVSCHRRDALASLKGRHQVRVGRAGLVSYIRPPGSKIFVIVRSSADVMWWRRAQSTGRASAMHMRRVS